VRGHKACAIYTRKSSEEGLGQEFNSLHAQREACEAYVLSQKSQGWKVIKTEYDDGGFSGGNTKRPALIELISDIKAGKIKVLVVYKVDRLTRSLADFAKLVELFDEYGVSFVSVTQQFNTTTSMGRLTLNVLLSFAQFEREVTGERIRDKIAASKRKGMWMGGMPPVGYTPHERTLQVESEQAEQVRTIFQLYLELKFVSALKDMLDAMGWVTPVRFTRKEREVGGKPFSRGHLYRILRNPIYIGKIVHKGKIFDGNHSAIIDGDVWVAVQKLLDENHTSHKSRKIAAHPSLLMGLLFDEHGNKLTPSHTTKGKRRYRYYILQYPSNGSSVDQPAFRVPAQELERTVIASLAGLLNDKARLLEVIGMKDAAETYRVLEQATRHAEVLTESTASDKIELLNRLVVRIELNQDKLIIIINSKALLATKISDSIELVVPVKLKRCGMAMKLIVRAPTSSEAIAPDLKVLALIAKGNQWFTKLISGQYDSIQQVAQEVGVSRSYCTRLIYLSFLAPSIIQLLLDGKQPPELNADQLKRCVPLPVDWNEQHKLLGFDQRV